MYSHKEKVDELMNEAKIDLSAFLNVSLFSFSYLTITPFIEKYNVIFELAYGRKFGGEH